MEEQGSSQASGIVETHDNKSQEEPAHVAQRDVSDESAPQVDAPSPAKGFCGVGSRPLYDCIAHFRSKWPRTYSLLVRVLIPLFGLIGVSFLCGFFLARMESKVEIENNDAILKGEINYTLQVSSVAYGNYIPSPCIADYDVNDPEFNATGLRNFLDDCQQDIIRRRELKEGDLTFDWIICDDGGETPYIQQYEHVLLAWTDDYFGLAEKYATELNMTAQDASNKAMQEATGHSDCTLHTAAGALFWFTILTTIGYGWSLVLRGYYMCSK